MILHAISMLFQGHVYYTLQMICKVCPFILGPKNNMAKNGPIFLSFINFVRPTQLHLRAWH